MARQRRVGEMGECLFEFQFGRGGDVAPHLRFDRMDRVTNSSDVLPTLSVAISLNFCLTSAICMILWIPLEFLDDRLWRPTGANMPLHSEA